MHKKKFLLNLVAVVLKYKYSEFVRFVASSKVSSVLKYTKLVYY